MKKKVISVKYIIEAPSLKRPLKIVQLSDIHGRPSETLLTLTREAKPDLIAVTGDTLERYDRERERKKPRKKINPVFWVIYNAVYYMNRFFIWLLGWNNRPNDEKTYEFLREISRLAPVYISLGNHEEKLLEKDYAVLKDCGITLLDNRDIQTEIGGVRLNIGGLSTEPDEEWLRRFEKKDGYKILLSHHPEYFDEMIRGKDIDLVLSGHNHGGQVRLFGKGLISSGLQLFPRYDRGSFENRLIVSAGCSNTAPFPRFGNPMEVVTVLLNKK